MKESFNLRAAVINLAGIFVIFAVVLASICIINADRLKEISERSLSSARMSEDHLVQNHFVKGEELDISVAVSRYALGEDSYGLDITINCGDNPDYDLSRLAAKLCYDGSEYHLSDTFCSSGGGVYYEPRKNYTEAASITCANEEEPVEAPDSSYSQAFEGKNYLYYTAVITETEWADSPFTLDISYNIKGKNNYMFNSFFNNKVTISFYPENEI